MSKFLLLLPILAVSCSYNTKIGAPIGNIQYHKVQATSLLGPSQTMIVAVNTNTQEIIPMTPMGGNGLAPALLQGGALVGGSLLFGKGIKPDQTTVNQTGTASAESDADATSNAQNTSTQTGPSKYPKAPKPTKHHKSKWD